MFKNRFILVLGVLSLVLATMAVSNPKLNVAPTIDQAASDFHERHPDWQWVASDQKVIIPLTGDAAFPDYHQRHPELSVSVEASVNPSYLGTIGSYRSPRDKCFDVPLREVASCHDASETTIHSYRSPLDECFDVSIREVASCRGASRAPTP